MQSQIHHIELDTNITLFWLRTGNYLHLIFPEEKIISQAYEEKRIQSYSSGRLCARQALEAKNIFGYPLLVNEHVFPQWPENISGSISHTDEFTIAVAVDKDNFFSIGIDIEKIGRITKDLWSLLFTKAEQDFLEKCKQQDFFVTAFFSLKEAFYKMFFPLTLQFLDYLDCEIEMINEKAHINILKSSLIDLQNIQTHFFLFEDHVISAIVYKKRT